MCGVAGIIQKKKEIKENDRRINLMTDAIAHRGPDDEGHIIMNNVALGHRRLSIIDLDSRSKQPLWSSDRNYVISFNGEIYNYVEIREDLKSKGVKFRTTSDTEVIIEAYREYGIRCIDMFNGMWVFCIWDRIKNKLILCRDRFGIKPLYILDNGEVFAFCSEIKGITAAFPDENIPNNLMIYRYLSGTLNENVDGETYYKNINIFPAAHYMYFDLNTMTSSIDEYWGVDEHAFWNKWIKGKNPYKTFKRLFDSAIELRLRADVEVGACLSGGIDSSVIVGCASEKYNTRMHTFSSIYNDKECNEEEYVQAVNELWKTCAHYIRPDDEEKNFERHICKINYHHDGPAWGASLYSQYMVMMGVSKHVKVVLDGQGADELFAGYIPYYAHYIADLTERDNIFNRIRAIKLLTIVNREWPDAIGAVGTDQIVNLVGLNNSFRFQNKKRELIDQLRRSSIQFTSDFMSSVKEHYNRKDINLSSKLNTRLCNDVINKSIPALLHNEDSNSMAFSIESRVPFLDYRIVEFAIALDGKYKIKNQWTKWIIRKSLRKYLPKKVIMRKNKMGFPAPFSRWLREGESKEEIKNIIYSFGDRNIVPVDTIDNFYKKHVNENVDMSDILFKYYSMELWLRTCVYGRTI